MTQVISAELNTRTALVAGILGSNWQQSTAEPFNHKEIRGFEPPDRGYIQGQGNERLTLYYSSEKRNGLRLVVAGLFPKTARGEYIKPDTDHSITIAADRNPEAVAKDIERRLLPDYRVTLQKVIETKTYQDDYNQKQESNTLEAAKLLGVTLTPEGIEAGALSLSVKGGYGDARIYADAIRFDRLSLPIAVALQVLEIIGKAGE